jgi:hypothetical protein
MLVEKATVRGIQPSKGLCVLIYKTSKTTLID